MNVQLQFGTAFGLYLFDRNTVVWHTFFFDILSPETRLSDECVFFVLFFFSFPPLLARRWVQCLIEAQWSGIPFFVFWSQAQRLDFQMCVCFLFCFSFLFFFPLATLESKYSARWAQAMPRQTWGLCCVTSADQYHIIWLRAPSASLLPVLGSFRNLFLGPPQMSCQHSVTVSSVHMHACTCYQTLPLTRRALQVQVV